jgi:hypothetical protein
VNVQGLGQNDSQFFIARVAPANLWKDNAKTGKEGLGNRCKIIVFGVHWNGDDKAPLPKPEDLPWAWSLTPPNESVATQQFKGGELVVGMWADAAHQVPVIFGHVQKTEHFEVKSQPENVESTVSFDSFEGKSDDTQETPNNRALSPSGGKTLIEDPKSLGDAMNKGPLYDLKSDFPIDLGGSFDFGSFFSQALSGNLNVESLTGSVTGALSGALTSQVSSLTESLGSISIPGTGISIDPGASLGAAAQSLASGDISSLSSIGGGALSTLQSQLGGTITQQFDSLVGDKLGSITQSIETALGDIPLAGDVASSLGPSLSNVANSAAESVVVSALSGSVNTGEITSNIVGQLNSVIQNSYNNITTINSPTIKSNANIQENLQGVAEEILTEVVGALVSSVPSSVNLSSLIPSLNIGLAAAQAAGSLFVSGGDIARGSSYAFSERLNFGFNRFLYQTTAVVKVEDVYMDPITEQVLDMTRLVEDLRDEVQVSALTFFNMLQDRFSSVFDDIVEAGIQDDYSGLVYFPVEGEEQTVIFEGESNVLDAFSLDKDKTATFVPKFSYPDAVYPLIDADEAAEILTDLYEYTIPEIESNIYNAIEELLISSEYIDGVNTLVDRVVQTVTASDDNVQLEFSIALIVYLIAKFEETVLKTDISQFPLPQLFALGAGFELGEIGSISKYITTELLQPALGTSSELTSKSYVAGLAGQVKTTSVNYNDDESTGDKIKREVERIQSLIGYGNSDIDIIISYLNIFGGNSQDTTSRKIDTSSLTSLNQYQDQLDELGLNQYAPQTATTGSGASIKPVVEYEYEGDIIELIEGSSGGTSAGGSSAGKYGSVGKFGSGSFSFDQNTLVGIATTGYPRLNSAGNTITKSKVTLTTTSSGLSAKSGGSGKVDPPTLLNASVADVTVKSGGSGYNKTKPPTIVFLNNPVPKSYGYELPSNYSFRKAKGDAMIDDSGHIIGVRMTDFGSGYINGATLVVDTAHPKTASGENMDISLTGAVVTTTGSHYNPSTDRIEIRYQSDDGKIKTVSATASSINPVGISSSPNELVQTQTVIGKDGSIQQIKRVENFNNLTLRNIIAYHKPDNIITTITYEKSYLTGINRLVGIVTATAPFDNSPLLQEQEKVKNSSKIASIKDSSGVRAVFNFDNAAIAQVLYGPGGQILKVEFNKYLQGLAGMPEFTMRSPTGTGMQLELQLSFNIIPEDKKDNLDNQVIEEIDGQLYVDGEVIFGQTGISTSIDCIGKG